MITIWPPLATFKITWSACLWHEAHKWISIGVICCVVFFHIGQLIFYSSFWSGFWSAALLFWINCAHLLHIHSKMIDSRSDTFQCFEHSVGPSQNFMIIHGYSSHSNKRDSINKDVIAFSKHYRKTLGFFYPIFRYFWVQNFTTDTGWLKLVQYWIRTLIMLL